MDTEHVNGAAPQEESLLGERLLALLEGLPEALTDTARLTQYRMLLPDLAELYEADSHVAFDLVVEQVTKKLRVKAQSIRQDISGMVPPAEEPSDAKPEQGSSQASRLVALAHAAVLWHTPEGDLYATI